MKRINEQRLVAAWDEVNYRKRNQKSSAGQVKPPAWSNLEKNLTQTSYHTKSTLAHNSSRAEDALRQGEERKTRCYALCGLALVT